MQMNDDLTLWLPVPLLHLRTILLPGCEDGEHLDPGGVVEVATLQEQPAKKQKFGIKKETTTPKKSKEADSNRRDQAGPSGTKDSDGEEATQEAHQKESWKNAKRTKTQQAHSLTYLSLFLTYMSIVLCRSRTRGRKRRALQGERVRFVVRTLTGRTCGNTPRQSSSAE